MKTLVDLTGHRYGRWTVLSYTGEIQAEITASGCAGATAELSARSAIKASVPVSGNHADVCSGSVKRIDQFSTAELIAELQRRKVLTNEA